MTIETVAATATADLAKVKADAGTAVTDIKTLIANRVDDVFIAFVVLVSIWVGHVL